MSDHKKLQAANHQNPEKNGEKRIVMPDFKPIEDISTFYVIITPEQDQKGKIILNRKLKVVRTWYFCSQQFNKADPDNKKVIDIINDARNVALAEAWHECGFTGGFKTSRPKSCNENTARKYMTNKLVIVLDEFDINEKVCQIHSGLLCRNIDDDPQTWKKINWGKKLENRNKRRKNYNRNYKRSTLADVMPDKLKAIGDN